MLPWLTIVLDPIAVVMCHEAMRLRLSLRGCEAVYLHVQPHLGQFTVLRLTLAVPQHKPVPSLNLNLSSSQRRNETDIW